jgi:hypothetical protein
MFTYDDILYEPFAIEQELERLYRYDFKSTYAELRRRAARRVRYAIRNVLRGVRPRLKGY